MQVIGLLAAAGLVIGVGASLAVGRLIESQLFEMQASDPAVILGATVLVLLVSILAGYLPARRATHIIDPMQALRWE
jgi:ABC-type antimicrobial peptide transport system permease subunit